jgi:hypothetical protein
MYKSSIVHWELRCGPGSRGMVYAQDQCNSESYWCSITCHDRGSRSFGGVPADKLICTGNSEHNTGMLLIQITLLLRWADGHRPLLKVWWFTVPYMATYRSAGLRADVVERTCSATGKIFVLQRTARNQDLCRNQDLIFTCRWNVYALSRCAQIPFHATCTLIRSEVVSTRSFQQGHIVASFIFLWSLCAP